jgi:hypothetical protein
MFCYCNGCGCAWQTPAEAKLEAGLNAVARVSEFAPGGVEAPTRQAIIDAGLVDAVVADFTETGWGTSIANLNRRIVAGRLGERPS